MSGESAPCYARWNDADKEAAIQITGGGLAAYAPGGWRAVRADIGKASGVHYLEGLVVAAPYVLLGFAALSNPLTYPGDSGGVGWGIASHGYSFSPGSVSANGQTLEVGDYVGALLDREAAQAKFWRIRGEVSDLIYTADISSAVGTALFPIFAGLDGRLTLNAGQSGFAGAVPAGARRGFY